MPKGSHNIIGIIGETLGQMVSRGLRGLAWLIGAGVTVWGIATVGLVIGIGAPWGMAAAGSASIMLIVFVLGVVLVNFA